MQLIIGGMGFIGLHTARALLDMGETCVLTRYRHLRVPDFIQGEIGTRLFVEPLDVTDRSALFEIGARHPITGIIHLADPGPWRSDPLEYFRMGTNAISNVLEAAQAWKVRRVAIASTIGIYGGVDSGGAPLGEDLPLPMFAPHPIPTFKKVAELIGSNIAARAWLWHSEASPWSLGTPLSPSAIARQYP